MLNVIAARITTIFALLILCATTEGLTQQQPSLTRIAFGSCADQERPQLIWSAVLNYKPQLFLFAGDNVYGDIRDGKWVPSNQLIDSLRHAYEVVEAKQPEFMKVKRTIPHLATWDDHDYGKNDGGADFYGKQEAQRLFLKFWNIPTNDPRHSRPGVYYAQTYGPPGQRVQVIMLDARYFRSPLKRANPRAPGNGPYAADDDPAKTMLGDEQWKWLADRLREPAELRLIVSSTQVLAEGHGWETWGNLPRERQRLFGVIRDSGANGVIFLSGDRHFGAIYRESTIVPYPLIDVTSSGINQKYSTNEPGPNRIGEIFDDFNFGSVDVDWSKKTVTLSIRSINGQPVRQLAVLLGELAPTAK